MDMISQLSDDLLIKILSRVPTKDAVSTSLLSKRWKFLWMWLPKLEYGYSNYPVSQRHQLRRFLYFNMPLHKAPIIECLRLKFHEEPGGSVKPEDIKQWVSIAVSRSVRELTVKVYNIAEYDITLPSSLYFCKSIVFLKLTDEILVDVPPMACFPSLKTLFLRAVTYSDKSSLQKLLSSCPVLEDLVVIRYHIDNLENVSICVHSLQRLTLRVMNPCPLAEVEIKTPSLKYLTIKDYRDDDDDDDDNDNVNVSYVYDFEDMPNLEEANLDMKYPDIGNVIRPIISVKRLQLCLGVYATKDLYDEDIEFNQLQHLKICSCDSYSSFLLECLLRDSPNLQELEIIVADEHTKDKPVYVDDDMFRDCPLCFHNTLKTFKWVGLRASEIEIQLARYIMLEACLLETVTCLFHSSVTLGEKSWMTDEIYYSFSGSGSCNFRFD